MKNEYNLHNDVDLYYMLAEHGAERERAFAELYSRHGQRVYLYCRKILGDSTAADDVFQDTFIRFLNSVSTERVMTNVAAFLLRIARNLCLNYKRDHKTNAVMFEDFHLPTADKQVESQETARLITMALDLLPDEYREALVLQMYNGMSYEEIGEQLGVPVTTVRNWVVRAKKRMREILAP
ncbi:MAG: RNA polymerase sigma factor, partial [Candidatus Kapabacteria bacterium]|nr:RNA polymerase sigma factor [Candidatus Kapabacteria bacterium]